MSGAFLPGYRPPGEPVSHRDTTKLQQLENARAGGVIWENSLATLLRGERTLDIRGIYHFNRGAGERQLGNAVDYCMRALGMREWFLAKRIRRGLIQLLQPFYANRKHCCALVLFESCRDLVANRFREFARQGVTIEQVPTRSLRIDATCSKSVIDCQRRPLMILDNLPISMSDLPFVIPDDHEPRSCKLRGGGHDRQIVRPGEARRTLGRWRYWCLAESSPEDNQALQAGQYTTRVRHLVGDRVNPARIMTWMAFHPVEQISYNLCLDFDPWTERVLSVRYVIMTLRNYLDLDPRMDYWLSAAMHHRKPLSDEQIDSPRLTSHT